MAKSILKALPPNSNLKRYVEGLMKMGPDGPSLFQTLWQSEDPADKLIAVWVLCQEEPRLWKLPLEIVRDYIVLPTIKMLDGPAAVAQWKQSPCTLDDYTQLICDREERLASPRKRSAPKPDIARLVRSVVLAVYLEQLDPKASHTANYVRTAKRLDIDRQSVRRIVEQSLKRNAANGMYSPAKGVIQAAAHVGRMLRLIDGNGPKLLVQNGASRIGIASNKGS